MKRIWTFLVISFGFLAFSISFDQTSHPGFAASAAVDTQAFDQPIFSCFGNNKPSQPADNTPHDTWVSTSTGTNVPSVRDQYTAIWNGSEMIVWGGLDSQTGHATNTGGRYNPSTDSWTPTGTSYPGGPIESRRAHTAVWTGNEMIIFGGLTYNPLDPFNPPPNISGGKYNPETDSWVPISVPPIYFDTCAQSAIWTGTEMIIWGGSCGGPPGYNTGGRYNPSTDSWASTSTGDNVPSGRSGHSAIWTESEMIIWGGFSPPNSPHNDGGKYDPVADSWLPVSTDNAPSARTGNSTVWTGSQMIIWGGEDSGGYTNTGEKYNPSSDTWTPISIDASPSARRQHTTVWTGSKMIVWGGLQNDGLTNTGGKYDPVSDSWSSTSTINSPSERVSHTAVWTGFQMIVWGGDDATNSLNTGGIYTP